MMEGRARASPAAVVGLGTTAMRADIGSADGLEGKQEFERQTCPKGKCKTVAVARATFAFPSLQSL